MQRVDDGAWQARKFPRHDVLHNRYLREKVHAQEALFRRSISIGTWTETGHGPRKLLTVCFPFRSSQQWQCVGRCAKSFFSSQEKKLTLSGSVSNLSVSPDYRRFSVNSDAQIADI